jgi:Zn-dependent oligopeptidase
MYFLQVLNRKPVAYLVCNGSPPVGDVPSLMTFREVEYVLITIMYE